jgi:hypothetical protein
MPQVFTSADLGAGPNGETYGYAYERSDAGTLTNKLTAVAAYDRRTVPIRYRRNTYLIGTFTRAQVRDRFGAYHSIGVLPPTRKPTLADGAATGSTGNMIGYQTFCMIANGVLICESNPGPQTDTLVSAGTGRVWTNLDWGPVDSHVTHARGYVSVDGALPALAWERPINLANINGSVTENVLTGALGRTLPVRKGIDQQFQLDVFARGVPPYCKYAEEYHDAFFYAGDPIHPERIYVSKLFEPEAVNSTPVTVYGRVDEPWLTTTDGLPVMGLQRQGDELIVGTPRGIDRIQGYGYGDYAIHRISNYWNVISHFSMRRCGPLDSLFFASSHGPTIYNSGSFRFIGANLASWWREQFRLYPTFFANAFGVESRYWQTYNLLIPQQDNTTLWLVVDFNSAEAGLPIWVWDIRNRQDWVSAELAVNATSYYWERYTGDTGGEVRQEDVMTDADDDNDTYQKRMTVQSGHRYMGDQSGDEAHGHTFGPLDLFLQHENQAATISVYAGEDDSPNAASPAVTQSLPARAQPTGKRARTKRSSERVALAQASGKGITTKVEVVAPIDVEFRGWAVQHREGPAGDEPFA